MSSVRLNAGGQCLRFVFIAWNILVFVSASYMSASFQWRAFFSPFVYGGRLGLPWVLNDTGCTNTLRLLLTCSRTVFLDKGRESACL